MNKKRSEPMNNEVFVNRTLNLKRIKYIGVDMDHTLIRYYSEAFEQLSHSVMIEKLIKQKAYPEVLRNLTFSFDLAIRGLVIDRNNGNLLKVSRHGGIRVSYHGTKPIDFKVQQKLYKSTYIDLGDANYLAVDTTFSISLAVLFAQLVDLKDAQPELNLPHYSVMADDALWALDDGHRDGSIKDVVKGDLARFIIKDESVVKGLEIFKKHGKKIFVLTNSDFYYTQLLLDYAVNPFLKEHGSWQELFELVITFAQKPKFFYGDSHFLKIDPKTGLMSNFDAKLVPGIFQGGNAAKFTSDLNLQGDEILYVGDHIYGDILRLKKDCNWRTAMVIEELAEEIQNNQRAAPISEQIDDLMKTKEPLEDELTEILTLKVEAKISEQEDNKAQELQKKIGEIDTQISQLIKTQLSYYNSTWGPLMRAGNEESYFANQVDRYACIYMTKLSDLLKTSPRTYFRASRRPLAHEVD